MSGLMGRRLLVFVIALALAMQTIRNAAVMQLAALQPPAAARFWEDHPEVGIAEAMAEIGAAARARATVGPETFDRLDEAAIKSPLSPEPFLVHGVQAQTAGDMQRASRAFRDAQWRDPRSVPAAYFLAQYYLRSGAVSDGLKQTALLSRLMPETTEAVSPFIAAYARNPATWPQIRELFRTEKNLQSGVLAALARDPKNAEAILAVADGQSRRPDSNWLTILLSSLVRAGAVAKARAVWTSIGRGRPGTDLLYDAGFSDNRAPPPFNWSLTSSTVGLAERQPGKRLHVLFYGNDDGVLASQLLMLQPGTYRLQMGIVGASTNGELLSWSLRCNNSSEPFATAGVVGATGRGWTFAVPSGCPAQWIELTGRSGDVAQQADATIADLSLRRAGGASG